MLKTESFSFSFFFQYKLIASVVLKMSVTFQLNPCQYLSEESTYFIKTTNKLTGNLSVEWLFKIQRQPVRHVHQVRRKKVDFLNVKSRLKSGENSLIFLGNNPGTLHSTVSIGPREYTIQRLTFATANFPRILLLTAVDTAGAVSSVSFASEQKQNSNKTKQKW